MQPKPILQINDDGSIKILVDQLTIGQIAALLDAAKNGVMSIPIKNQDIEPEPEPEATDAT